MFTKAIAPKTKNSLAILGKIAFLKQFYLAGGTAVALHLGHRLSFDLDFFTAKDFKQKELVVLMKQKGKFVLDQIARNTLLGIFENTKVSFFRYDYPLIAKTELFCNTAIVSREDLMAMKIDAISTRGKKRDFIDLFFLTKKDGLIKAFDCYKRKYKKQDVNLFHALKSLDYFWDAEKDEGKLKMLKLCNWREIKEYFLKQVPKVLDEELERI